MKFLCYYAGKNACDKCQNAEMFFVEIYKKSKEKKFTVCSNLTFELNYIILFIGIYINNMPRFRRVPQKERT